jgi:hypothetical protein
MIITRVGVLIGTFLKNINQKVMTRIEIRDIKDEPVDLYSPSSEFLGTLDNQLQFNDVRVQIKRSQQKGYYIKFRDECIPIDSNGELLNYPRGLFDMNLDMLNYLLDI